MRLTRIEIDGFGCLRDLQEDLAPGLHLFHGPNESGKSTLQQAALALLYGFYQADRARKSENEARERYMPWSGGSYGGRLEYELENGPRFRVQRQFDSSDVPTSIWDLRTGRDVTEQFGLGRHGNVPFARRHVGMPKSVFEACAFVSQGELFAIADEERVSPREIGDTIVALADTARRDISAQSALNHLDHVLKERVGGPRSRTTPLPVAKRRLEQARQELLQIDAVRQRLSGNAAALEDATERAARSREEAKRIRYLVLRAQVTDLGERLEQIRALEEEDQRLRQVVDSNKGFAAVAAEELDAVRQTWGRICDLRERLERDRPTIEETRSKLRDASEGRERLVRRVRELGRLRHYPADRGAVIDELATAWRSARAIWEEAEERLREAKVAPDVAEEYEQLEREVGSLTQGDLERLTLRLRAPGGRGVTAVLKALRRALVAVIRWLWRRAVQLTEWLLRTIRRRPSEPPAVPRTEPDQSRGTISPEAMSADEVARTLARHQRFLEISPLVRAHGAEAKKADAARRDAEQKDTELRDELRELVDDTSDLDSALRDFGQRLNEHRELMSIDAQLEPLEGERSSLQQAIDRFERDEGTLDRLESTLGDQLRDFTGASGELEDLIPAFEEGCRRRRTYEGASRDLRENEETRGLVLRGRSPAELQDAKSAAQAELGQLVEENPLLEGALTGETSERLEASLKTLQEELHQRDVEIASLRTTIDRELASLRPRAEVEEELEQHKNQVAILERFAEELGIAMEVIEAAMTEAHRNFAPSVGRFLGSGLSRITGNRYKQVFLDSSTLGVTAEVPETRRLEDVEMLSRGTRAAAYLLLRIGLAQHMSAMGEPVPLILDDPLVDLDDVRVENFLELLLELSGEAQILLFTKDEETKTWFERSGCDGKTHRITLLPPPYS